MENDVRPLGTHASAKARWLARLFAPEDIASLVFFRISVGLIFLVTVIRYFAHGWIADFHYPETHFTYYGFGWIKPFPGWMLYAQFVVMGLASLGLMLGLFYRLSAVLCFITFSYVFLLEQADYLNHFYLMCLLGFLMIFLPAHRALSLDAWRKPHIRSDHVPAWPRWLLLAQLSVVYFYAGIAKLNPEWLSGMPPRIWLADTIEVPIIGPFLASETGTWVFTYGGMTFDLLVVPLLLWRKTRMLGYLWALAFHLLNFAVFDIGVFPWMMILATLLYFSPDWPRRWFRWKRSRQTAPPFAASRLTTGLAGVWLLMQLLVPLRHLLYPGMVHWTEEGHRFSWHMMLNNKSGTVKYVITDPVTKQSWEVRPRQYLTRRQAKEAATCPDMLLQFAHFLARAEAASHNYTTPLEVRAISRVSLNGRPHQPMVDPQVNLAAIGRDLKHAAWILPLKEHIELAEATNSVPAPLSSQTNAAPRRPLALVAEAAERGDAAAQLELSEMFRDGTAGATNLETALSWSAKAAETGLAEAQYLTALAYAQGQGTATNLILAMKWSTLAARQSHVQATGLKDELRQQLTPFQLAFARRLTSDLAINSATNSGRLEPAAASTRLEPAGGR